MFDKIKRAGKAFLDELVGTGYIPISHAQGPVVPIESLFGGAPIQKMAVWEQYMQAGTGKVWAAHKCASLVAEAIASTPWSINRIGTSDPLKVPGLDDLMQWPNPHETWRDQIYRTSMHLSLTGMAFWYKSEANLKGDKPREIYCLNPKRVRIIPHIQLGIAGYIYTVNGTQIPIDVEEMLMFRRPNPNHDLFGLGDIESGVGLYEEAVNRSMQQEAFYANGAHPSAIMINEDSGFHDQQEAFEDAKRKWHREYGGKKNNGKLAWISGKWKYQQVSFTNRDLQELERSNATIQYICLNQGVPLSVIGIKDAANYATAEIDEMRFKRYTILPAIKRIEDTIQTDLIVGFNPKAQLVYDVKGLVSIGQTLNDLGPLFDRGGITINEMRKTAGLPTDPDNPTWNQTFIKSDYVPTELAGMMPPAGATDTTASAIAGRPQPTPDPGTPNNT